MISDTFLGSAIALEATALEPLRALPPCAGGVHWWPRGPFSLHAKVSLV